MYQGIANLAPSGPHDGGLCVLKGSHLRHKEFFDATGGIRLDQDAGDSYNYKSGEEGWYRKQGCEEVKICAGQGDLICKSILARTGLCQPTGTNNN